jgi:hypothetical protein
MSDEPQAKKPAGAITVKALEERVQSLTDRLEQLERKQKITTDSFEFTANELRPLYGFGAVALVFDAVHRKLTE